jgi:uncharacterized repeat protein (TIGR01451 family)
LRLHAAAIITGLLRRKPVTPTSKFLRRLALTLIVSSSAASGASILLADPASPVTITDVDTPDPVASGAVITHSITIVNTGGAKISNVVMSDQLNGVGGIGVPPQLQIASTRGSCAQSGTLVTCNGGQIEGNGSWTISIRGIVTAANGTVLNNTVSVTGTKSAQNFTTTNTTTTLVSNGSNQNLAELSINKTGPTSVVLSSPMTYTLTVNNTGTQNATSVKVIDTVPAGITGIEASGTSLFVCTVDGQTVTCDQGLVNQGSNATITINGIAPGTIGQITNTAVVDPDNTIAESNELNNTSALVNTQVTDLPDPPALGINITDDPIVMTGAGPDDPVVPGAMLTYKILATNNAATRADDVVIVLGTQGLEASSVLVSQVVTNGTVGNSGGCTNVSPQAKCVVRTLNPGGTVLMTVSGYVIGFAGSNMIGTATVTGNIKNKGVTNTDTELTTVMPQFDLTITKADSPDPVCAASYPGPGYDPGVDYPTGSTCQGGLTYTFSVGNSGLQTANGVTVRDPLPAGVIFDHVTANSAGFSCTYDVPTNVVTCTGGTIPGQSTRTLAFVTVAPAALGSITNVVTVDPNNAIFEADESNNTFAQTTQVATGVDLTVAKHSNHEGDSVATRGTLTYTIKVSNIGTQDATNILVRDALPADTIFRDAVSDPAHGFSCSQAGGVVDCINGHVQGTRSMNYPSLLTKNVDVATITIRVFATAYEQPAMHNEVRVDPLNQIGEANENNNLAVQNTKVLSGNVTTDAFNELRISKVQSSPDPTNTARNAVVTYTVKVWNEGTDPVVGVKVRDTLPAGAQYIEATGTNSFLCQQQILGVVDCVGGQIAANTLEGSGATLTVKVFAPDTPATYTNQVEVDPDHTIAEGNEFNNNASAQTVVKNHGAGSFHELNVKKTQISPAAGNTARNAVVTYSIVVTNDGSDAVNGVVVRDKLPAGARYIHAAGDHQFLCTEEQTGIVDCVNGEVGGVGGTATITLKMFAPDTPGLYTNQVNVDPDNTIPEGDEFNNQSTADTTVVNGGAGAFNDLTIIKTSTPDVKPGGLITYSLQIGNTGSDPALDVTVRDVLPFGESFVGAADAGVGPGAAFTCSEDSGVVNCINGSIVNGTSRTIVIKVTAPQQVVPAPGLHNTAVVDPDNTVPEGDEFNNTDSANTTVTPVINLTITKDGPTTATQSEEADYTIKVRNNGVGGSQAALGVRMHDPLPVGLIPLTVDAGADNNWACQITGNAINVVDCLGDLGGPDDGGNEVTITIHVFITAESGPMDNVACVDPDNTITESNELDNCSDHGSFVAPPTPKSPDIMVSKSVDAASTTPGSELDYTITISNVGTAKAKGWDGSTGLTLFDTLSNQLEFTNFTTTNGWDCVKVVNTIICHDDGSGLDVGESAQVTILATVKASATVPISNTAVAGLGIIDPSDPSCASAAGCQNEVPGHVSNNSDTVVSSISSTGLDLSLGPIADAPDPVNPGQALTYTVVGVNGGTTTASSVHIAISVPSAGVTFMGAAGSNGFLCGPSVLDVVHCFGDLPGGGSTTITLSFIASLTGLPPSVTLSAEIDPGNVFEEFDEGNNTQSQTTTINTTGGCSLCVDVVASQLFTLPDPLSVGGAANVTFQVVNVGDQPTTLNPATQTLFQLTVLTNVSMDPVTLITSSLPGVTCGVTLSGANFSVIGCKGNLAAKQGVTLIVRAPNVRTTRFFAIGEVDPADAIAEFSNTNNVLIKTTVIQ